MDAWCALVMVFSLKRAGRSVDGGGVFTYAERRALEGGVWVSFRIVSWRARRDVPWRDQVSNGFFKGVD